MGCKRTVVIKSTIEQWEAWTKMKFSESGEYAVEGALCPVVIS